MFFYLSKVVYFLIAPSHLCLLALALGVILLLRDGQARMARWLLMMSLTGFVVFGFSPLGNALMLPLEERFPRPAELRPGSYQGIIFLGGFEDGELSTARRSLALIDAAERLTETLRLARRLPATKVVFTGGSAAMQGPGNTARQEVGRYLKDVGLAADRVVLEDQSRNTWENALYTRRLLRPAQSDRFLLVTSAWHMPRAVGAFQAAGLRVTAYPVDYRTRGPADLTQPFSFLPNGLRRMDKAVKEWIGLLAYWLTGRSSALFPGP